MDAHLLKSLRWTLYAVETQLKDQSRDAISKYTMGSPHHGIRSMISRRTAIKDRFFICDFFAFCKEKSSKSCSHLSIGSGKLVFAKIGCGSHYSPSIEGYSLAPAPRYLRDQTMSVETTEDPAHLGAGFFLILTA